MKVVVRKPAYGAYVQKYYEKTVKFVHKATEVEKLDKELPPLTFDDNYLQKLEEKVKDKKEKAANILFTLNRLVLVEKHRSPIYESLVERVEKLLEMWKEKTRDYERIYKEGVKVIEDVSTLSERQRSLGFSDLEYSMLLTLEEGLGESDGLAREIRSLSERLKKYMFPGWINQTTIRKEVEREVRRFVRSLKTRYGFSLKEMNDLYEKLMESVKNYGAS
jgi:type I restriction enzyme R subunit